MAIPIPRDPAVELDSVPRYWLAGSPAASAISSGLNMLFPVGERFFVRSVKRYLDRIPEGELREQVKAFFKQEGKHASAHDDFNDLLRRYAACAYLLYSSVTYASSLEVASGTILGVALLCIGAVAMLLLKEGARD